MAKKPFKGNRDKCDGDQFVKLPHVVLNSPSYRQLSYSATRLLVDLAMQYSGTNNGRLVACSKYLKPKGWTSNATTRKAVHELIDAKLLIEVRKGGFPNLAAWYALGWLSLDVTEGLDIDPKAYRRGLYRGAVLVPIIGARKVAIDPVIGLRQSSPVPIAGAMR